MNAYHHISLFFNKFSNILPVHFTSKISLFSLTVIIMHGMGRVPDEVGHLILSEDGAVIAVG